MHSLFIVDDDILFQRIMKMTFIKYPVFKHVHYFTEGNTMLAYLAENKNDFSNLPDVIFLDLEMPGFDGWKVLEGMQKFYSLLCKKIAVYIVTASILDKDKVRGLGYEFVREFISKPLYGERILAIDDSLQYN